MQQAGIQQGVVRLGLLGANWGREGSVRTTRPAGATAKTLGKAKVVERRRRRWR
ncbi:hypothetical protein [Nonomuraea sp. NPDC049158]|uniref:hypothetical protein n=1 Tax=Nonomuraea sp. NPDC049158 TaxID=3155649 RepID=UPI00340BD411